MQPGLVLVTRLRPPSKTRA